MKKRFHHLLALLLLLATTVAASRYLVSSDHLFLIEEQEAEEAEESKREAESEKIGKSKSTRRLDFEGFEGFALLPQETTPLVISQGDTKEISHTSSFIPTTSQLYLRYKRLKLDC